MALGGVTDIVAKTKKDTGVHPNKLVVTGSCTEEVVREAIATLDAGRGKFTIVDAGAGAADYKEFACSPGAAKVPKVPNSADELGFRTYVYRARRPFNQRRLGMLLTRWPLQTKKLDLGVLAEQEAMDAAPGRDKVFAGVLRSKGSAWLDVEQRISAAWSQAGRQFRFLGGGHWWATLPEQVMRKCLSPEDFDAERALFEGEDGDRRQELVFIGTNMDVDGIESALNACLLSDEEMREYRAMWAEEVAGIASTFGPFRFDIGTRVECNLGSKWSAGVVVDHYYREERWPPEDWTPYQIQLDDGPLIFAPADEDDCIRAEGDKSKWLGKALGR